MLTLVQSLGSCTGMPARAGTIERLRNSQSHYRLAGGKWTFKGATFRTALAAAAVTAAASSSLHIECRLSCFRKGSICACRSSWTVTTALSLSARQCKTTKSCASMLFSIIHEYLCSIFHALAQINANFVKKRTALRVFIAYGLDQQHQNSFEVLQLFASQKCQTGRRSGAAIEWEHAFQ